MIENRGPLPDRDPTRSNAEQGAYQKFKVARTDGSSQRGGKHYACEYFVLDVDHDSHAKAALAAYAAACAETHPQLSRDLIERYELKAARQLPTPEEGLITGFSAAMLQALNDVEAHVATTAGIAHGWREIMDENLCLVTALKLFAGGDAVGAAVHLAIMWHRGWRPRLAELSIDTRIEPEKLANVLLAVAEERGKCKCEACLIKAIKFASAASALLQPVSDVPPSTAHTPTTH